MSDTAAWPPRTEAAAAGNLAAFVEWLRATGRRPDATPALLRHWQAHDTPAWHAAIAAFAELPATAPEATIDATASALFDREGRPDDTPT